MSGEARRRSSMEGPMAVLLLTLPNELLVSSDGWIEAAWPGTRKRLQVCSSSGGYRGCQGEGACKVMLSKECD
jgi:hypothetical protein